MRSPCRNSGFATTSAIFLIALVAAAMLAVTTLMRADVNHSTQTQIDAQLRQLLHAGACEAARGELSSGARSVSLPAELTSSGASVSIASVITSDGTTLVATIEASFAGHERTQVMRFVRENDRWRPVSAELQ